MSTENKYYVYEHWRTDTGVIFYVGKGHGRRAYDMRRGRNRWHKIIGTYLKGLGLSVEVRIVHLGMAEVDAFTKERELIAYWRGTGAELVNQSDGGEGPSGRKHTEEWKLANSLRMKGRPKSAETRAKLSASNLGKTHIYPPGYKRPRYAVEASAERQRGKPKHSLEGRAKMSVMRRANPTFKGKTHTAEWRSHMREIQIGIPKSEQTKARMRKPKSEEHKQKLREINLGKTHSEETRAKLSEMGKADWVRRKAKKALENRE